MKVKLTFCNTDSFSLFRSSEILMWNLLNDTILLSYHVPNLDWPISSLFQANTVFWVAHTHAPCKRPITMITNLRESLRELSTRVWKNPLTPGICQCRLALKLSPSHFILIHGVYYLINRRFGDAKEVVADRLHKAETFIKVQSSLAGPDKSNHSWAFCLAQQSTFWCNGHSPQ